jgi:hypothetical protein
MSGTLLLAFLVTTTSALASSGHGNAFGPYDVNPALTTGDADGFRKLYVDPAQLGSLLAPAQALGQGADDVLHVRNATSAWTELSVSGVKVGIIGPLATITLRGVQTGTYDISCIGPTGMNVTRIVSSGNYEALLAQAETARLADESAQQEAEAMETESDEMGESETEAERAPE